MKDQRFTLRIRDPIHGTIHFSRGETRVIDSPVYQRLRMIKQLGLADLAFPGATHTRYAHGLGTMHVASRMFDQISRYYSLPPETERRLRQTVRLAALTHDLGHAPLSHTTEAFMPPVETLELGPWQTGEPGRRASHEDYTLKLLTDSDLTARIEREITPDTGVTPAEVATLVAGRAPSEEVSARFVVDGLSFMPVLRQCVSSELDADRMDYLLRDSYYAGVPYGRYDLEWILDNLRPVERDGAVFLGLDARASFSFEDFLLSRYHMFTSVYFHQTPIAYEVMLRRFHDDAGELEVPSDVEGYLRCDDVYLWNALRASNNPWARRVVERRAYRMLFEAKGFGEAEESGISVEALADALRAIGIEPLSHQIKGELSKYVRADGDGGPEATPLYIVTSGQSVPVERYTPLYQRYATGVRIKRLYVEPERHADAKQVLAQLGGITSQRPGTARAP